MSPREVVAARHPLARCLLGEDDRIEDNSVGRLNGHHAAGSLIEIVELHPGFERLGFDRLLKRRGHGIALPLHDDGSAFQPRIGSSFRMRGSGDVLQVRLKLPTTDWLRDDLLARVGLCLAASSNRARVGSISF